MLTGGKNIRAGRASTVACLGVETTSPMTARFSPSWKRRTLRDGCGWCGHRPMHAAASTRTSRPLPFHLALLVPDSKGDYDAAEKNELHLPGLTNIRRPCRPTICGSSCRTLEQSRCGVGLHDEEGHERQTVDGAVPEHLGLAAKFRPALHPNAKKIARWAGARSKPFGWAHLRHTQNPFWGLMRLTHFACPGHLPQGKVPSKWKTSFVELLRRAVCIYHTPFARKRKTRIRDGFATHPAVLIRWLSTSRVRPLSI